MNEIIEEIDRILETSRRKKLAAETIEKMVRNLEDPACFVSWCSANYSREGQGTTHIGLAARIGNFIYLGLAEGAVQEASPGRAWPELKPWNPAISAISKKISNWAHNQKIKIELNKIDHFYENLKKSKFANLKLSQKDQNIVIKEEIKF